MIDLTEKESDHGLPLPAFRRIFWGSMRRLHLIGQIFGRLTVIDDGISKGCRYHYLCRCECGKTSRVLGKNLTNGNSQSCGCVARSMNAERMAKQVRIHGGEKFCPGTGEGSLFELAKYAAAMLFKA